ncbi:MAG: hypothetical protein K8T89_07325 [Planctomycetes bacterium]|nr:hypothetical protein [Planctomycetota bacterium]
MSTKSPLILLLLIPSALHAEDPQPVIDYYPLAMNYRWTYRIQGQEDRLSIVVTAIEKVGETRCFRLEGRLQNRVVGTEHVSKVKDGVYRHRNEGSDIDPPILFCKVPTTKSDTWKAEYKFNDRKTTIDYSCEMEEVFVPAGRFQAIVVRAVSADGPNKLRNTTWYAPKVGMVKQVIEDGDEKPIVLTLERFDRGFGFEKK